MLPLRAAMRARSPRATKRGAMAARGGADGTAIWHVHDSCFRAVLEVPKRAADFLRRHLPDGIVRLLADEPPEILDGAHVEVHLRNRQTDRLIRAKLNSGGYLYVIVEHASSVDPEMAFRLLRYRLLIWDREKKASSAKSGSRTPILALVVYNGKARWTAPHSLLNMVTGDPEFREEMRDFGYRLLDLGRMPEDRLERNPDLKGGLLTLAHACRGPVDSRVLHRIRELNSEGTILETQTYKYILHEHPCPRRWKPVSPGRGVEEFGKHLDRQRAVALGGSANQISSPIMPVAGIPIDGADEDDWYPARTGP